MNGRSASGTSTLPSACWYVSRMAISRRGTAHAVAFSVWQNSVAPLRAGGFPAPSAARGFGLAQYTECHMHLRSCWRGTCALPGMHSSPIDRTCSPMFRQVCSDAVSHALAAQPLLC